MSDERNSKKATPHTIDAEQIETIDVIAQEMGVTETTIVTAWHNDPQCPLTVYRRVKLSMEQSLAPDGKVQTQFSTYFCARGTIDLCRKAGYPKRSGESKSALKKRLAAAEMKTDGTINDLKAITEIAERLNEQLKKSQEVNRALSQQLDRQEQKETFPSVQKVLSDFNSTTIKKNYK